MFPVNLNNKITASCQSTLVSNNNDKNLAVKYSDLTIQLINPLPMRKSHDKIATNSNKIHPSGQIKSLFLSRRS